MVYKPRRERKRGGKAGEGQPVEEEHGHQYNAQGSPEEKAEFAKSDGFKRGGAKKRKHGGHVDGEKAKHHLGKRARGGAAAPHVDMHFAEHEEHGGHDGAHHHGAHHHHRARGGAAEEDHSGGDTAHEAALKGGGEEPKEKRGGEIGHRARGGRAMARGGSPFSSARKLTDFENKKNEGPGEQAPVIP